MREGLIYPPLLYVGERSGPQQHGVIKGSAGLSQGICPSPLDLDKEGIDLSPLNIDRGACLSSLGVNKGVAGSPPPLGVNLGI